MNIQLILFCLISLLTACSKVNVEPEYSPIKKTLIWQLDSSGFGESKLSILQNNSEIANYSVECDLSSTHQDLDDPESPTVDLVNPASHPLGLLVVVCNVGAHSKQISVFNPFINSPEAVFTKTGSYVAGWEIVNGILKISYDRECIEGKTNICDERFEQVSTEWPNQ